MLEDHYAQHPNARPSLVEVAQTLAAQMGSPLATQLDVLAVAAAGMTALGLEPAARDVIVWATAQGGLDA